MHGNARFPWSTNIKQQRIRRVERSACMGRLDTSKAGELRMLAEKFRRRARDMTLLNYMKLMQQAAIDLDAEAAMLEEERTVTPGRHLDISI